jgi:hypothetical protein
VAIALVTGIVSATVRVHVIQHVSMVVKHIVAEPA